MFQIQCLLEPSHAPCRKQNPLFWRVGKQRTHLDLGECIGSDAVWLPSLGQKKHHGFCLAVGLLSLQVFSCHVTRPPVQRQPCCKEAQLGSWRETRREAPRLCKRKRCPGSFSCYIFSSCMKDAEEEPLRPCVGISPPLIPDPQDPVGDNKVIVVSLNDYIVEWFDTQPWVTRALLLGLAWLFYFLLNCSGLKIELPLLS